MPRYLYLFRHAEAADKTIHQTDKERELTAGGMQELMQMGTYLLRKNFRFDSIICSTAFRAQETAKLLADIIKFDTVGIVFAEDLYEASVRTLFGTVTGLPAHHQHVMLIGHNPALTYLAEYLTRAEIGTITTSGLVVIRFDSTWNEVSQGTGTFVEYTYPALLRDSNTAT